MLPQEIAHLWMAREYGDPYGPETDRNRQADYASDDVGSIFEFLPRLLGLPPGCSALEPPHVSGTRVGRRRSAKADQLVQPRCSSTLRRRKVVLNLDDTVRQVLECGLGIV